MMMEFKVEKMARGGEAKEEEEEESWGCGGRFHFSDIAQQGVTKRCVLNIPLL